MGPNGALSPRMEPELCTHFIGLVAAVGLGHLDLEFVLIVFFDNSGLYTYLRNYLILALLEEREEDGVNTRILQR